MLSIIISHSYHKTGDTLIIRCEVTSELLSGPPGWQIYWRHGDTTYSYLGSRGNVHMYDNGIVGKYYKMGTITGGAKSPPRKTLADQIGSA